MTEEEWWEFAQGHPLEAMKDPFFDLLTLADPGRWIKMEFDSAPWWVDDALPKIPKHRAAEFADQCFAHVYTMPRRLFFSDPPNLKAITYRCADKKTLGLRGILAKRAAHHQERVWQWRLLLTLLREERHAAET